MGRKRKTAAGPYLLHLELLRDRVASFDRFPYCLPVLRNLDRLAFHPKVTFLVGENGAGKSTLLEALAVSVGLNPEGGSRNFNFATRKSHSDLDGCLRVAKTVSLARDSYFLRAESDSDWTCFPTGVNPCTTNRTGNPFSLCSSIGFAAMGST
jgi:predicted ATPase